MKDFDPFYGVGSQGVNVDLSGVADLAYQTANNPPAWLTDLTGIGETAYNRSFDLLQMQREDNQLQRFVADADAAGISPIAAMGKAGSYGAIGSTAGQGRGGGTNIRDMISLMTAKESIARSRTERELLSAKTERERAETAGVSGRESRATDMHGLLMEGARLQNASAQDQVNWLAETFPHRVVSTVENASQDTIRTHIARQERFLAQLGVEVAYRRNLFERMEAAWRTGATSFTMQTSDLWNFPTDITGYHRVPGRITVPTPTVDLSSLRHSWQVEFLANQLAIETNGYLRDITRKRKNWFEVLSIGQMITGGAGAVGAYMPYMQGTPHVGPYDHISGYGSIGPDRRR